MDPETCIDVKIMEEMRNSFYKVRKKQIVHFSNCNARSKFSCIRNVLYFANHTSSVKMYCCISNEKS